MPTTSGAQALERVRAQIPDLILLDLMMPEMDGLGGLPPVEAEDATRQIPVIFLTASNEMGTSSAVLRWGRWITSPSPSIRRSCSRVQTHRTPPGARTPAGNERGEERIHGHRRPRPSQPARRHPGGMPKWSSRDAQALAHREWKAMASASGKPRSAWPRWFKNLLDANRIERGEMRLQLEPTEMTSPRGVRGRDSATAGRGKQQTLRLEGGDGSGVRRRGSQHDGAGPGKSRVQRRQILASGQGHPRARAPRVGSPFAATCGMKVRG